ncbi:flagellar protein FlaG [Cohnella faecalis]|uniref:Flagellar biosynthesis protein FlaG n=1 Tax=Cohnella faecalis TaxID=2315694 RepID=A0A398CH49_9BACL|nr:flagellar protein FlaG [Cohnella faecalis]RIE02073.1 flagellar biosynthesis protein FlaG [Cohnella faecalis]
MEIQAVGDSSMFRDQQTIEKKPSGQEGTPSGKAQQEPTYGKADLKKELNHLNSWLQSKDAHLQFVLHDKLNEYYVQLVDNVTNEVIKEIPSKKMMDIVASFYENIGIIIDKKI